MKIHSEKTKKGKKKILAFSLKHLLLRMFMTVLLCAGSIFWGYAQNMKTVTVKITEANGEPIIGASVIVPGTNRGGSTDINGNFSLQAAEKEVLTVSLLGYINKQISVGANSRYEITLEEDLQKLDEVVVVGYGTQKRVTISGSVASVQAEELVATKNTNVQNMITGKLPGVRNIQKTSEPGQYTNQFDIRGMGSPLIVIDGVPRGDLPRMDPNDIESISVLKDASAAIYGMRAANGVFLITTKSGEKGKSRIEYSGYYGVQIPAEILQPLKANERAMLFSERSMRSVSNPNRGQYDDSWFSRYAAGEINEYDWYGAVMRSTAPEVKHNVSINGGSDKVDYYVNLGYINQESFWVTNATNETRYNLRANLSAQITKNLKASARLSYTKGDTYRQFVATMEIFKALWRSRPEDAFYANNNPEYLQRPSNNIDHGSVIAIIDPKTNGFVNNQRNIFTSTMALDYDFEQIKGLKASFTYNYDMTFNDNTEFRKEYTVYDYNSNTGAYEGVKWANPNRLNRYFGYSDSYLWNIGLNYKNTLLGSHHLNTLLLYEERFDKNYNFSAQRELDIPIPYLFAGNATNQQGTGSGLTENASRAVVGRLNYDYVGKYILEFAFRYDGSSKFPKGKQWGFFPSIQLGYRISEESFIKNNLSFIDNLKLRGTWGKMGDDSTSSFQFVEGYDYPVTSGSANGVPRGYMFGNNFVSALGFRASPNNELTWMVATAKNIGVDADFSRGIFGFSVDAFQRDREGIMANPEVSVPGTFGSGIAQANLNADRIRGFEVELKHRKRIGDFYYNVMGSVAMTRSMPMKRAQTTRNNSYNYWQNNVVKRWNDIHWGYASAGVYQSWEEIAKSKYATSGTLPGDPIYQDWNNDGTSDGGDSHPLFTTTSYPLMNFGLTLSGGWKSLDFHFLFQGSGLYYVGYGEQLREALAWDGNGLQLHLDRWRPNDPNADPYNPKTQWISGYYPYGNTRADANSEFNMQKGNYLRLKSMEIGFTVPQKYLSKLGVKKLRVYANGYNLLTFTKVRGLDPEHPTDTYGYMYPLNQTLNFGGTLSF